MSEPTRQFTIDLPERLARRLEEEVAAGSFPDVATGVRESVEAFLHDEEQPPMDEETLRWIKEEVIPTAEAVRRGAMKTHPVQEGFALLRERLKIRLGA